MVNVTDSAIVSLHRRQMAVIVSHGAVVNIVSWTLAVAAVCALGARFATKFAMRTSRNRLGLDDLFISLAAIFSFGQTVAVSLLSIHALGQHGYDLTPKQKTIYEKTDYVASMLYVANMGCARISVCCLIAKILPSTIPRYTAIALATFTMIWTVCGVLVTSFACGLPHPWESLENERCFDVVAFASYIGVSNIVAETLLIAIPLILWNVRLSARKRISVSVVFLTRLSVIAAVSSQLSFIDQSTFSDPTYDRWPEVLFIQVAQNLGMITACLPYLHPLIARILAGTVESNTISLDFSKAPYIKRSFNDDTSRGDSVLPVSSRSSSCLMAEKNHEPYCRPLATYGLDSVSNHHHSHSMSRFTANVARPVFNLKPPENVFNRLIEVPQSRPTTSSSAKDPLAMPKQLSDVGILPAIDWDVESSASEGSRRSGPSRRPTTDYIFSRQKVISVPDDKTLYDEGPHGFTSPQPSPRMSVRSSRAF